VIRLDVSTPVGYSDAGENVFSRGFDTNLEDVLVTRGRNDPFSYI